MKKIHLTRPSDSAGGRKRKNNRTDHQSLPYIYLILIFFKHQTSHCRIEFCQKKKKKKQTKIIYGARWHDYARHIDLAVEKRVGRREANGMRPILDCWIENTHYCTRTEGKFTSNLTTPVARLDLKKNECGRLVCSLIVRIYRFMTNKIFNRSHGF